MAPQDGHRHSLAVTRRFRFTELQWWQVFVVQALLTYSTGIPAHLALYTICCWSRWKGQDAKRLLADFALISPGEEAKRIPFNFSRTIPCPAILAFSTIALETRFKLCFTLFFSLDLALNFFNRRLSR